jgi:hypothetical protein
LILKAKLRVYLLTRQIHNSNDNFLPLQRIYFFNESDNSTFEINFRKFENTCLLKEVGFVFIQWTKLQLTDERYESELLLRNVEQI